jgi:hypothetical protein
MIVGTIGLIILNSGLFIIGVIIWDRIWFSRFGVQIPCKREVREDGIGSPNASVEIIQGSLKKLIKRFGSILWKLDTEHWI